MSWLETLVNGALLVLGCILIAAVLRFISLRPSNSRSWVNDNKRRAWIDYHGDEVTICNVRDFEWRNARDYSERWIDMTFRLDEVSNIWLFLEYFEPAIRFMAHTILSFEFEDGRRVACSVEVRRRKGKKFSAIKGAFRHYELIYVWATERDVIGVRTRCRKRSVTHLFEGVILEEGSKRKMFESYLRRTNKLHDEPEWYDTTSNTCTSNIARHVNDVYPSRVPAALAILMPGLSPRYLKKKNLIKIEGSLAELMKNSIIDQKARAWDGHSDFGDCIRGQQLARNAGA